MATVTISHAITRLEDFEGTPPGTFGSIGGGPGGGANAELTYEGLQSAARRINTTGTEFGFTYVHSTTIDQTSAGNEVLLAKAWLSVYNAVCNPGGTRFGIGDTTSDYHNYQIGDKQGADAGGAEPLGDGQFTYPAQGGWILLPINPNLEAWRNLATVGTPDLTIVDMTRYSNQVNATSTGANQAVDALDYGDGWNLTEGTGADDPGTFQDFVAADEASGDSTAGRAGFIATRAGAIFVYGGLTIGRTAGDVTSATAFSDELQTIIYPGGFVSDGWNKLEFDLDSVSTAIDLNAVTVLGRGRQDRLVTFDSELEVVASGSADAINASAHGLRTGDALRYIQNGGSAFGLVDDTEYYVFRVDANNFMLYSTCANAFASTATNSLSLAPTSTGEGIAQFFRRQPDTRPDLTFVSEGGSASLLGCVLNSMRRVTVNGGASLTNCTIITSQELRMMSGPGTLSGCTFDSPTVPPGEGFVRTSLVSYLSNFVNCTFVTGGSGHAFEIEDADTGGGSIAMTGLDFTGYGVGSQTITPSTVDGTLDELVITGAPFVTGDPVYYNSNGDGDTANSDNIGLAADTAYWVRLSGTASYQFHLSPEAALTNTNPVPLTQVGGSTETQVIYSADAAFFNDTNSAITISIAGGGEAPTVRNAGSAVTTILNQVAIKLDPLISSPSTEVRVYAAGTTNELAGSDDVDTVSFTFLVDAGIFVDIRIFNVEYLPADLINFEIPSVDTTVPIQQVFDRNYSNP